MINLIPNTIKQQRGYGRRNQMLLGYSLALLVTAFVTATIFTGSLRLVGSDEDDLRTKIADSTTQIQQLEQSVKEVEAVAKRLETAKELDDLSVDFSVLIPQIAAVLPNGVILNSLSLTGGNTDPLILDVDLADAQLGPVLSRNLVESDLFEAADIVSLAPKGSSQEGEGEAVSQYTATATLSASFTGTTANTTSSDEQTPQEGAQ